MALISHWYKEIVAKRFKGVRCRDAEIVDIQKHDNTLSNLETQYEISVHFRGPEDKVYLDEKTIHRHMLLYLTEEEVLKIWAAYQGSKG